MIKFCVADLLFLKSSNKTRFQIRNAFEMTGVFFRCYYINCVNLFIQGRIHFHDISKYFWIFLQIIVIVIILYYRSQTNTHFKLKRGLKLRIKTQASSAKKM